jgi:hypothetical protein
VSSRFPSCSPSRVQPFPFLFFHYMTQNSALMEPLSTVSVAPLYVCFGDLLSRPSNYNKRGAFTSGCRKRTPHLSGAILKFYY